MCCARSSDGPPGANARQLPQQFGKTPARSETRADGCAVTAVRRGETCQILSAVTLIATLGPMQTRSPDANANTPTPAPARMCSCCCWTCWCWWVSELIAGLKLQGNLSVEGRAHRTMMRMPLSELYPRTYLWHAVFRHSSAIVFIASPYPSTTSPFRTKGSRLTVLGSGFRVQLRDHRHRKTLPQHHPSFTV